MTSKPNILFILADDLGWGDVSYHGSDIRTPNIDRLVRNGVELDQHYVCPMCTPTRACFMTGRHPGRFGRHATSPSNPPVLPDGYETIAASLRNCGYDTGLFGKWHLGSAPEFCPNNYGFNVSHGSLAGGVDPYLHRYKEGEFSYTWHHDGELINERGHVTDLIADQAVEFIETRESPWFCYVPFTAVHTPIKPPQEWVDTYEGQHWDDDPGCDHSFKLYAAYTSHMDHAVGRFMEALQRTCQVDNTIVVFTSDNGAIPADNSGDTSKYPGRHEVLPRLGSNLPLRGRKAQLYEGGVRTPSVVSWPGTLSPGARIVHPMHIVDWMPTFCGMLDYHPDNPRWDGTDVWPLLSGATNNLPDRPIFWNFRGMNYGVRYGQWKLTTNAAMEAGSTELFNIAEDEAEQNEISRQNEDVVSELTKIINEQRSLDDTSKRPDAPA